MIEIESSPCLWSLGAKDYHDKNMKKFNPEFCIKSNYHLSLSTFDTVQFANSNCIVKIMGEYWRGKNLGRFILCLNSQIHSTVSCSLCDVAAYVIDACGNNT